MIILLNGPLGIGKSTLAEALTESIDDCAMLNGDQLIALNPAPAEPLEYLHSTLALLIDHHRQSGYRHFVVDHVWFNGAEIQDLLKRVVADVEAERAMSSC